MYKRYQVEGVNRCKELTLTEYKILSSSDRYDYAFDLENDNTEHSYALTIKCTKGIGGRQIKAVTTEISPREYVEKIFQFSNLAEDDCKIVGCDVITEELNTDI